MYPYVLTKLAYVSTTGYLKPSPVERCFLPWHMFRLRDAYHSSTQLFWSWKPKLERKPVDLSQSKWDCDQVLPRPVTESRKRSPPVIQKDGTVCQLGEKDWSQHLWKGTSNITGSKGSQLYLLARVFFFFGWRGIASKYDCQTPLGLG